MKWLGFLIEILLGILILSCLYVWFVLYFYPDYLGLTSFSPIFEYFSGKSYHLIYPFVWRNYVY